MVAAEVGSEQSSLNFDERRSQRLTRLGVGCRRSGAALPGGGSVELDVSMIAIGVVAVAVITVAVIAVAVIAVATTSVGAVAVAESAAVIVGGEEEMVMMQALAAGDVDVVAGTQELAEQTRHRQHGQRPGEDGEAARVAQRRHSGGLHRRA